MSVRAAIEYCARNLRFRRRLPREFGGHVIWTSPDARLRYLRPGEAAFDRELLQFVRHFTSPGQVVFDIGANVGEFAVAACHFVGRQGAVLAIEPDPFLCALLHRTIAEPGNVGLPPEALCVAVAEKDGFAPFHIASRGRASNALANHGLSTMGNIRGRFMAPVFTVDTLADRWRAPGFIKIDVEGAELLVLEGAPQTLMHHRPLILLEVTSMQDSVHELLTRSNYRIFAPTVGGELIEISQCAFNTLAVPEEKIRMMKVRKGIPMTKNIQEHAIEKSGANATGARRSVLPPLSHGSLNSNFGSSTFAASILATILCCLIIIFASFYAVYPSPSASAQLLWYVLVFNVLPGTVVTRLILPRVNGLGTFLIFSLGAGVLVNILVVILLWSIDQLSLLNALPVAASVLLIGGYRRLRLTEIVTDWEVGRSDFRCLLGTVFLCLTALLAMAVQLIEGGDNFHFAFQGVIVRGLQLGHPPPNLLLPDVPWSYNYAAHLWILGVNLISGLSIEVLVARYGPLLLCFIAAAMMLAFARRMIGLAWWIAPLPVICVFWVLGMPSIAARIFGTFMPLAGILIMSPFLAVLVFFVTIAFVVEGRAVSWAGQIVRGAILALLIFLATGARGVCPPILICALALRLLVTWHHRRAWPAMQAADLFAGGVGFAVGLRFFFTAGTSFSGTGFVKITGQPFSYLTDPSQWLFTLPHTLMQLGVAALPAGMISFTVVATFQAAFLTPALPASFAEIRQKTDEAQILLLGSAIAGIAAFFATKAPGYSHVSFLYFSNVALSLLGGRGLQLIISGEGRRHRWSGRFDLMVMAAVFLLACLHLAQLPGKTINWLGHRWSASALSLLEFSSQPPPRVDTCTRSKDADLFASAARISSAPVIIVLPLSEFTQLTTGSGTCEALWWIVRSPLQTIMPYALTNIPGSASPPLQKLLSIRRQHMVTAIGLANQDILSAENVVAIAKTVDDRRTVFVLAASGLFTNADPRLQLIDSNDRYGLWRVLIPDRDNTGSEPQ